MARALTIISVILCMGAGALGAGEMPHEIVEPRPQEGGNYDKDREWTGPTFRRLRKIRREQGNAAAEAKLGPAFRYFQKFWAEDGWGLGMGLDRDTVFDQWGFWVWHEAQYDTGVNDPEWSLMLYRHIYEEARRQGKNDWVAHVRSNLIAAYGGVSQWTGVRKLVNEGKDYFESQGFSLDTRKYPDRGQWTPEVPVVRKRDFPMMVPNGRHVVYWQRREQDDPSKPIYIDNMTTNLMFAAAREDLSQGNWQSTLETSFWIEAWSDAVSKVQRDGGEYAGIERHVNDDFWNAKALAADACDLLDLQEKKEKILLEGMANDNPSILHSYRRYRLEIGLVDMKLARGEADESILARMDQIIALEGVILGYAEHDMDDARVTKAECLTQMGRGEEGDAILEKLRGELDRKYSSWLSVELAIVDRKVDQGKFDGVRRTLEELLAVVRERGLKIDELPIYSAYVRWARASGNFDLALRAQRELLRLLEGFSLVTRLPLENARLAAILMESGNVAEGERLAAKAEKLLEEGTFPERIRKGVADLISEGKRATPVASGKALVVMQPFRSVSMALKDFPSRMVLTLSNLGNGASEGILRIKGAGAEFSWDETSGRGVVRPLESGGTGESEKILIQPEMMAVFDCVVAPGALMEKEIAFDWVAGGVVAATGNWSIGAEDAESGNAVIDAGAYENNPFYLIPIHHHLQSKGKETANLRVIASRPCRVEMYDVSGTLQMVDAEGNGSLRDSGDWIGNDSDRNLFAEITPDAETGETRFLLNIDPGKRDQGEPLEIRVEWLVDGKWFLAAMDTIVTREAQ